MTEINPVLQAIANRVSVRAYQDRPVPRAVAEAVLKAAMAAPSAKNAQPWRFWAINRRETLNHLADVLEYGKMLVHAPLAFVVAADRDAAEKGTPGFDYWIQDCSAAVMNLLLAAEAKGLGAVWLGVTPVPDRVRNVSRVLSLPTNVTPLCVVAAGYPAETPKPKDKYDPGKIDWSHWTK